MLKLNESRETAASVVEQLRSAVKNNKPKVACDEVEENAGAIINAVSFWCAKK